MSTLSVLNTVIPAGESLSDPIDCSGGNAVRITFPTAWTGANLTFAISTDGNGYNNLVDANGTEVMLPVVLGAAMPIDQSWSYFWNFVRIGSGSAKNPVPQEQQRDFAVTLIQQDATMTTNTRAAKPKPTQWAAGHHPTK